MKRAWVECWRCCFCISEITMIIILKPKFDCQLLHLTYLRTHDLNSFAPHACALPLSSNRCNCRQVASHNQSFSFSLFGWMLGTEEIFTLQSPVAPGSNLDTPVNFLTWTFYPSALRFEPTTSTSSNLKGETRMGCLSKFHFTFILSVFGYIIST